MNYKPKSMYFPISLNGLEYDSSTGSQIDRAQTYFNLYLSKGNCSCGNLQVNKQRSLQYSAEQIKWFFAMGLLKGHTVMKALMVPSSIKEILMQGSCSLLRVSIRQFSSKTISFGQILVCKIVKAQQVLDNEASNTRYLQGVLLCRCGAPGAATGLSSQHFVLVKWASDARSDSHNLCFQQFCHTCYSSLFSVVSSNDSISS